MLSYLLAVLAACSNATWFGGVFAITVGFLLQAVALGNGQLPVVEPILVLELPATLILAGWVFRTRRWPARPVSGG